MELAIINGTYRDTTAKSVAGTSINQDLHISQQIFILKQKQQKKQNENKKKKKKLLSNTNS